MAVVAVWGVKEHMDTLLLCLHLSHSVTLLFKHRYLKTKQQLPKAQASLLAGCPPFCSHAREGQRRVMTKPLTKPATGRSERQVPKPTLYYLCAGGALCALYRLEAGQRQAVGRRYTEKVTAMRHKPRWAAFCVP